MSTVTCLDMDGTLVDLVGGVLRSFDIPAELAGECDAWDSLSRVVSRHNRHGYQLTEQGLWATVDALGESFWAGLQPYPWAGELYRVCADRGPVVIMTTASTPAAAAGKLRWVQQHLPGGTRFALTGVTDAPVGEGCKHHFARPTALLVDDAPHYCARFREHGGQAFEWPAPWNGGIVSPHTHESAGWAALKRLRSGTYG